MIGFLRGIIDSYNDRELILDVGGVGYEIHISPKTAEYLPAAGEECKIYTYMSVREDGVDLHGFLSRENLNIFKQMITVSGIGPKGAQAVLSVLSPDDLRFAIISGDDKAISKAPGIGPKTAKRLILELKDKLGDFTAEDYESGSPEAYTEGTGENARSEAVAALVALGYTGTEAYRAVKAAEADESIDKNDPNLLLKAALKSIG